MGSAPPSDCTARARIVALTKMAAHLVVEHHDL
jgi:hypothetical protein